MYDGVPLTVGYKQRIRIHILLRNVLQIKRPHPGVLDAAAVATATVYPLAERARDCELRR